MDFGRNEPPRVCRRLFGLSHAVIGLCSNNGIALLLGFRRWDLADGFEQAAMVEPVDPFEGRMFDGLK